MLLTKCMFGSIDVRTWFVLQTMKVGAVYIPITQNGSKNNHFEYDQVDTHRVNVISVV